MKRKILAAAVAATAAFVATPASAAICIGISVNGAPTTSVACDSGTGSVNYNTTTGGYFYNVSGTGFPVASMPKFLTQSVNIEQKDGLDAVIDVYLTQTDLTSFNSGLLSSFTSNTVEGLTAEITSYYDAGNGQFTGTQLQDTTFTGSGMFTGSNALNVTSPWSETIRYRLSFTGGDGSNFNGTANLTAVPEPATWAMMLLGFAGVGMAMRRRRQPTLAQIA